MKFSLGSSVLVILAAATAATATNSRVLQDDTEMGMTDGGSYWGIYNLTAAPAMESCIVTEGDSVDMACCEDAGEIMKHADLQQGNTCFSLGEGLIPFSGCIGDGVAGYGENCVTDKAPFAAATAEECGCSFSIEGTGCFKANDIPGQQWFVYLDGDKCKTEMEGDPDTTPDATEAPADAGNMMGMSALAAAFVVAALV